MAQKELVFEARAEAGKRPLILDEAGLREILHSECIICGVDEAGRGPLAGPVCAAAVILPADFPESCLDDSKALSARQREKAYEVIIEKALDWAVGWATHDEIGTMNILQASLGAMCRAVALLERQPDIVLVDGNKVPKLEYPAVAVIKGDSRVSAIMAASILAKVARDRVMERLDAVQPEYGFSKHKGYPTAEHRKAIVRHGPSLWARPGFSVKLPQS